MYNSFKRFLWAIFYVNRCCICRVICFADFLFFRTFCWAFSNFETSSERLYFFSLSKYFFFLSGQKSGPDRRKYIRGTPFMAGGVHPVPLSFLHIKYGWRMLLFSVRERYGKFKASCLMFISAPVSPLLYFSIFIAFFLSCSCSGRKSCWHHRKHGQIFTQRTRWILLRQMVSIHMVLVLL